jgi:pimeloyl-ACP methyl ester carboxylesterase
MSVVDLEALMTRERLLAGTPVSERRVQLSGVSTAMLEAGAGPPVVLLHGGIECGGVYWAPVVSRLAERHRVVVPDVPGLGESEPVARLDAASFAAWLTALIEQTCAEKPLLVAHSLVGSLAARYAAQHGDALRQLVIYGTPGVAPYRLPPGLMLAAILFALSPSQRNMDRFARWAFLDPVLTRRQDPEWLGAFDAYNLARGAVPHVKRTMRHLIRTCTKRIPDTELRRIEIPVTLVWGRYDRMVPLRVGQVASSTHGWSLHVIEDAGHVPHIEQPDAFLAALRPALESSTEKETAA